MYRTIPTDIVIIYHANCRDGFSAAYAAWKKFGDTATYIPQHDRRNPPSNLENKEVYILDYSFPKDVLEKLEEETKRTVVIDHHQSAQDAVNAFSQNIFDLEHSGAVLAWHYFHPEKPLPKLFAYIEDSDLWRHSLEYGKEIGAVIAEYDFTFQDWNRLVADVENDKTFRKLTARGAILSEAKDKYVRELLSFAEKVEIDGHETYAVNCARPYRSDVGNLLAEQHPPFGIVWYHYEGAFHISLRSIGDFDVAALAEKYGGGGHKNAASIRVATWNDVPFQFL